MKEIQVDVQYFAIFREQRGASHETVSAHVTNVKELYNELRVKHGFTLSPDMVRAGVNGKLGDLNQGLADGDCVVLIPPVAGG
ncbi:MAG: MoaD/ThiS family protein [Fimbriimonadaceae bacterium]|nr:MoaD/ThiS family protein [Fimbriimonadaceae bacterium]